MKNIDLPKGWIKVKADELSILIRGITYKKENIGEKGQNGYIPIFRANNIQNNKLTFDNLVYIQEFKVKEEQKIKNGDIIFAMSSGSKHLVGKSAQAHKDMQASIGAFCSLLRPINAVCSKYIAFYFQGNEFRNLISKIAKGTNINNLKREYILFSELPLPPLNEQKRIVEKIDELFSELDNAVASLKKAQQQLKIYRQALLKNAFEGKLTNNTKDWQLISISDLGDIITGNTPSKKDTSNYGEEYNFYKPTDLNQGINTYESTDKLSSKGYSIARKAPKDSILVTCIGATIGKTGLIKKEGAFNQQINAIIPSKEYHPKFIYFQIVSSEFQKSIKENASSTTLPILNKSKFSSLIFKRTPLEHQNKIVSILEERLSIADNLEKTIEQALKQSESLRHSILKKAFEGKLVPQDPDDEPASKLLERIKAEKEKYLQEQKEKKRKPVKRKSMSKKLSIEEILENAKDPIPAKDVWQQSKYKDDIEAFYAELKKIKHKIKEIKKGTESLLELKK